MEELKKAIKNYLINNTGYNEQDILNFSETVYNNTIEELGEITREIITEIQDEIENNEN